MAQTKTIEASVAWLVSAPHRAEMAARFAACLLAFASLSACSEAKPLRAPSATSSRAPALHRGPLSDYVPAAGLRWMLSGKLRRIAEDRAFQQAIEALLPIERLKAFTSASGIDLARCESAVVAGFDLGSLYLVQVPEGSSGNAALHFQGRLLAGAQRNRPHPELERWSGVVGNTPQALVHFDPVVAVALGDPTLVRVVEAFAQNKLKRSPSALRGAALSTLAPPPDDAVAAFYVPGPFVGESAKGARGLLADAIALSVSMQPTSEGHARFTLQLIADLRVDAEDELLGAWSDFVQNPTGRLLGLDQPTTPSVLREGDDRLVFSVELSLAPLAEGVVAAVSANVRELMQTPSEHP